MAGGRAGAVAVAAVLLPFWDAAIELRRRPRRWHNLAPATSIRHLLQRKRRIDDLTGQSKPLINPNIEDKVITIIIVSNSNASISANTRSTIVIEKEVMIRRIFFSNLSAITPPKKLIIIVPMPKTAAANPNKNSDPLRSNTNLPVAKFSNCEPPTDAKDAVQNNLNFFDFSASKVPGFEFFI